MNFNVLNVQMGRVDGHNPHIIRKDMPFSLTNVYVEATNSSVSLGERKLASLHLPSTFLSSLVPLCLSIRFCQFSEDLHELYKF